MKPTKSKNIISTLAAISMLTIILPAQGAAAQPSGLLPLPDYSGSLSERSHLLGNLGGSRTEWAKKGFTFDIDLMLDAQVVNSALPNIDTATILGTSLQMRF